MACAYNFTAEFVKAASINSPTEFEIPGNPYRSSLTANFISHPIENRIQKNLTKV